MREKLAEWFSYNLYCDHCPIDDCDWDGDGPCVWDYQKADSILAMLEAEGMVMLDSNQESLEGIVSYIHAVNNKWTIGIEVADSPNLGAGQRVTITVELERGKERGRIAEWCNSLPFGGNND